MEHRAWSGEHEAGIGRRIKIRSVGQDDRMGRGCLDRMNRMGGMGIRNVGFGMVNCMRESDVYNFRDAR